MYTHNLEMREILSDFETEPDHLITGHGNQSTEQGE